MPVKGDVNSTVPIVPNILAYVDGKM